MKFNAKKIEECAEWVKENGLIDYGGAKLKDFCLALNIDNATYYRWMSNNSEFADAIKKAKEEFKESLENNIVESLARAAQGYDTTRRKTEYVRNSKEEIVIKKQIVEDVHVPANVGAAIFLLTNISPNRWKNRQKNEMEVSDSEWVGALKKLTDRYDEEDNTKEGNN